MPCFNHVDLVGIGVKLLLNGADQTKKLCRIQNNISVTSLKLSTVEALIIFAGNFKLRTLKILPMKNCFSPDKNSRMHCQVPFY